jgi:hypothetical protein
MPDNDVFPVEFNDYETLVTRPSVTPSIEVAKEESIPEDPLAQLGRRIDAMEQRLESLELLLAQLIDRDA